MCGIALIVSGIRIDTSCLPFDSTSSTRKTEKLLFSLDDLKSALRRRGPDSVFAKKLLLQSEENLISSFTDNGVSSSERDNADDIHTAKLHFFGATLQLRGINPLIQPLVDASGNVLVYNGEIFGGFDLESDCNDTEFLMRTLGECCSCASCSAGHCVECGRSSVLGVLSAIKGPWAIIYWQDSSRTLWFGRDGFGRRSLLVHWPTEDDSTFLLSSVSPVSPVQFAPEDETHNGIGCFSYWEELPCGIYSLHVDVSKPSGYLVAEVKMHGYANSMLTELIKWDRISVEPSSEDLKTCCHKLSRGQRSIHLASSEAVPNETGSVQSAIPVRAQNLLDALKESVLRRTSLYTVYQAVTSGIRQEEFVPVAILFSGGLDSMILAALLDKCLDPNYEIDLLNVSFDGHLAPDRQSAKAGLNELRRVAPSRKWRLVEIDADLSDLVFETSHVVSLINPANTYMDLNIGIALWLASGGNGWVSDANISDNDNNHVRIKYKSNAKILLVGSGADEQCAGYGRHRTSYRRGSWLGLHEEMRLDMQRIWRRNLGRDDRCIADNGKEARFPFLDEDVIRLLLNMPLWEVANLDQPIGIGDKKILREVAKLLGLYEAAVLPKRAIQFGSRIARESNRKIFGSNRAANQASAGSVRINRKSSFC
ncbi:asparagine synthetase domain-containing protein 1 isoform X1 [Vigna radiata var. radiata]|uniref:Asparagine synthetase domain-containing protein 1 isoform X1 n=1 Tax=Vigna radiata var. radiata TaxID=3916 RepID=A0A1S3UHN8_VIGRR|nr:asparagine synthetase domain-containing protein 1 isoform X1 [Vigna radiata var. radiata]